MSSQPGASHSGRSRWRAWALSGGKVLFNWVIGALVGAIAVDWFLYNGKHIKLLIYDQPYEIQLLVAPRIEGGAGFAGATPLFRSYRKALRRQKPPLQLVFEPNGLERLRICTPFEGMFVNRASAFDAFAAQFAECITVPQSSANVISIRAVQGGKLQIRAELFYCNCPVDVIQASLREEASCDISDAAVRIDEATAVCREAAGKLDAAKEP